MRNTHHILHDRKSWWARHEGQLLRESRPFMIVMDESSHNELHRVAPPVPVPSFHVLQVIARRTDISLPTLQAIDNLRFATEEAIRHPKCHEIERAMAGLMLDAIDVQVPFIKDAIQTWRIYA